jgi:tetratricopeptide (TPR) repeat protein
MDIAPPEPRVKKPVAFSNLMMVLVSAPLLRSEPDSTTKSLRAIPPLAVQEEVDAVLAALEELEHLVSLQIRVEVATVDRLGQILSAASPPLIIHFSGHGASIDEKSALVLEDSAGLARPMTADQLRTRLNPLRHPPCKLAVLNACYSQGFADVLLEKGVHHVVAVNTQETILDAVSRRFARHFYPPLLSGLSVSEAYDHAHSAVLVDDDLTELIDKKTHQSVTWDEASKFRLLPENSVEHETKLVPENTSGTITPPVWENTNVRAVPSEPFIGRRKELYEIARHLRETVNDQQAPRCVLLRGMGGMGKTALGLAAGRWQHERRRFSKGVWSVDLRSLTEVSQARHRIALTLRLSPAAQQSNASLASELATWRVLMILDDLDMLLEHQLTETADLLNSLLGCPGLRLIVTARDPLPGTVMYIKYDVERMDPADARVALLKYALVDTYQEDDMRWLMKFLDGYPFPIRLAGSFARIKKCSLRKLRQELAAKAVTGLVYPGVPENRDTSLAKTLDLSYDNLPGGARRMFPMLALFPAGITEDAARFIWDEESSVGALENLRQFSMAEEPEQPSGCSRRFELPEPARRYAERHQHPDAMQHLAPKALRYFYDFVEHATALIADEQDRHQGKLHLTLEQLNLDHFLSWGYQNENTRAGVSHSARITALLTGFWLSFTKGNPQTILPRLELAFEAAHRNRDQLGTAQVHKATGDVWRWDNEVDLALSSYTDALTLFQALNDRLKEAQVRRAIGDLHQNQGKVDLAIANYEEAVPLFKEVGSNLEAAQTQEMIADILKNSATEAQELSVIVASYEEALSLYELADNRLGAAEIHKKIGDTYRSGDSDHELDAAASNYETAVNLFRSGSVPNWLKAGQAQEGIADIQLARYGPETAIPSYAVAFSLYRDWNSPSDAARAQYKIADAQRKSQDDLVHDQRGLCA